MNLRNEFPYASRESRTQTMGAWWPPTEWPIFAPVKTASASVESLFVTTGKTLESVERAVAGMAMVVGYSAAALVAIYAYGKFKKVRSGR